MRFGMLPILPKSPSIHEFCPVSPIGYLCLRKGSLRRESRKR